MDLIGTTNRSVEFLEFIRVLSNSRVLSSILSIMTSNDSVDTYADPYEISLHANSINLAFNSLARLIIEFSLRSTP
jgi:hypothetical protein